jgi:hypothetical protein
MPARSPVTEWQLALRGEIARRFAFPPEIELDLCARRRRNPRRRRWRHAVYVFGNASMSARGSGSGMISTH